MPRQGRAETALSLAPDLSAAHEALGFVLLTRILISPEPKPNWGGARPKNWPRLTLAENRALYSPRCARPAAESENMARQALDLDP